MINDGLPFQMILSSEYRDYQLATQEMLHKCVMLYCSFLAPEKSHSEWVAVSLGSGGSGGGIELVAIDVPVVVRWQSVVEVDILPAGGILADEPAGHLPRHPYLYHK